MFTLTDIQLKAIDDAVVAIKDGRDFSITGLAGTGKTVVLCHLTNRLFLEGFAPQVCAPTGKAAQNVNKKFPQLQAKTLHSALSQSVHDRLKKYYETLDQLENKRDAWTRFSAASVPVDPSIIPPPAFTDDDEKAMGDLAVTIKKMRETVDDRLQFSAKQGDLSFDVVLFDEASMIGTKIYQDLIAPLNIPKIYFGDYGQLPPVKDVPAIDLRRANARLTEIHRQAQDSGILRLAYAVNAEEKIVPSKFECHDVEFIASDDHSAVLPYAGTHQVVCWMNKDRHALNLLARRVRRGIVPTRKAESWLPQPGEIMMADENHKGYGCLNGDEFEVVECPASEVPHVDASSNPYLRSVYMRKVGDPVDNIKLVTLNLGNLMPPEQTLDVASEKFHRENAVRRGLNVIWTYAITCHKAQGSEYPRVCVFRPSTIPEDKSRWLYTAVTRAAKELVIISTQFSEPRVARNHSDRLRALRQTA